jgi:hypothetical protein
MLTDALTDVVTLATCASTVAPESATEKYLVGTVYLPPSLALGVPGPASQAALYHLFN